MEALQIKARHSYCRLLHTWSWRYKNSESCYGRVQAIQRSRRGKLLCTVPLLPHMENGATWEASRQAGRWHGVACLSLFLIIASSRAVGLQKLQRSHPIPDSIQAAEEIHRGEKHSLHFLFCFVAKMRSDGWGRQASTQAMTAGLSQPDEQTRQLPGGVQTKRAPP